MYSKLYTKSVYLQRDLLLPFAVNEKRKRCDTPIYKYISTVKANQCHTIEIHRRSTATAFNFILAIRRKSALLYKQIPIRARETYWSFIKYKNDFHRFFERLSSMKNASWMHGFFSDFFYCYYLVYLTILFI